MKSLATGIEIHIQPLSPPQVGVGPSNHMVGPTGNQPSSFRGFQKSPY